MGALMAYVYDERTHRAFTQWMLDSVMTSTYRDGGNPSVMLMSSYSHLVFVVSNTAAEERWDWRRTKRELRRLGLKREGVRRPYHKRALDG